ncbi:hypothetical protein SDC9_106909 [bioreactor metagenome]|uniref:Helix-turn-helix domain-containing protein n=1 Tax=bioreactor metagenome TaxID=1076179 RepID=A0A645B3P2_9ZZZZ
MAQAAEWLQCSVFTIRRMIERGELRAYRYGPRIIRVDLADLQRLRRPVTPTAEYRTARSAMEPASAAEFSGESA